MRNPALDWHGQSQAQERQSTKKYEKAYPILNKLFEKQMKKRNRIAIVEFLVYNREDNTKDIAVETLYQWEQSTDRKA